MTRWPRQIVIWLRRVAPPPWAIVLVLAAAGALELVSCWIADLQGDWTEAEKGHRVRDLLLAASAAGYGLFRVWRTHPLFHEKYRNFLALTPWDRSKPLLLGPVHLVPQDALFLAILFGWASFRPGLPLPVVPLALLCSYLIASALALQSTRQPWFAYAILFGLGLSVRLAWIDLWLALTAAIATYPVAWQGIWKSLADLPWENALTEERPPVASALAQLQGRPISSQNKACQTDLAEVSLLWPLNVLVSKRPARLTQPVHGWMTALLVGWWFYTVSSGTEDPAELHAVAGAFFLVGAPLLAGIRLVIYTSSHLPPISFWGRLRTGRPVIPAYDVVFLAPLCVGLIGPLLYGSSVIAGCPVDVALGGCVAVAIGLALTGGPRLRKWQLTAPARLRPFIAARGLVEKI